jgi:hypothetical protein
MSSKRGKKMRSGILKAARKDVNGEIVTIRRKLEWTRDNKRIRGFEDW